MRELVVGARRRRFCFFAAAERRVLKEPAKRDCLPINERFVFDSLAKHETCPSEGSTGFVALGTEPVAGAPPASHRPAPPVVPRSEGAPRRHGEGDATEPRRRRRARGEGHADEEKSHRGSKGSSTSNATWHPLPVRLDHGSAFARHVFLRAPSKNAEGAAEGRALFVAAVPSGWSEAHLRELMTTHFGEVEEASLVVLDSAPDVAGGLVTFADAKSAKRALAAAVRGGTPLDPPNSLARAVGLEAWVADFRDARPGAETTQRRVDDWFAAFEEEEQRKARVAAASAAADDGWTVVEAKRGRRKTSDGEGHDRGRRSFGDGGAAATRERAGACGELLPLPAAREAPGELYELKAKFTLDKERVAKLKASRKFRPT